MTVQQNDMKHPCLKVFCSAFIMFLLSMIPILALSGGIYLYIGDYNHQTIPFLDYLHQLLHSGKSLPSYDWMTGLGIDFLAGYHDHLVSPYSWLLFALPYAAMPYVHTFIVALKIGFSAVTAMLWCRQYVRTDRTAFICGILYAFSGYQLFNLVYQFADRISLFPLMLLAFDLLVQKRKPLFFSLTLALSCLIDPLYAWMECLFIMIYYIVRTATHSYPKLTKGLFFQLAAECLCGVGISAVTLLPVCKNITGNSRAGNLIFDHNLLAYEDAGVLLHIIQSMFLPPEMCRTGWYFDDVQLSLSPPLLYIPLFTVIGVACIFRISRKSWYNVLLTVCAAIACVPVLNSTFSAMNGNYYSRWFFMPLMVMIMMTGKYLDDFDKFNPVREMKINAAVLGFLGIYGIYTIYIKHICVQISRNLWLTGIIMAAAGLGTLYILYHPHPKLSFLRKEKLPLIVCIFCTLTFGVQSLAFAEADAYEMYHVTISEIYNDFEPLELDRSEFSRVVDTGNINTSIRWHLPAVNQFHSMISGEETSFYDAVGIKREQGVSFKERDYALMSFLSVQYDLYFNPTLIGGIKVEPEHIQHHMEGFDDYTEHHRYVAFENKAFIPMGFTYDYALPLSDFQDPDFAKMEDTAFLLRIEDEEEEKDVKTNEKLLLKAIWLSEEQLERYQDLLPLLPEDLRADTSDEAYYADCAARAASACETFETNQHGFTAKANLPRENLVFFSVPHSEGFTAYVDGAETPIEDVFGGLSAVFVPAGEHEIEFRYEIPLLREGAVISAASGALLLLYGAAALLLNRKRRQPAAQ